MKDTGKIEIYTHLRIKDPITNKIFVDRRVDQPKKEIGNNERYDKSIDRGIPKNKR